jgi:hypothetical protein
MTFGIRGQQKNNTRPMTVIRKKTKSVIDPMHVRFEVKQQQ